eukprot:m.23543 g.23543  ORF g.23543 m.23543 type:complete len:1019 (+) comp7513_c0_seq1:364-3420(+)
MDSPGSKQNTRRLSPVSTSTNSRASSATGSNMDTNMDTNWFTLGQTSEKMAPLHYAASCGDKRGVREYLKKAVNEKELLAMINSQDNFGRTALIYAVVSGKHTVAAYLASKGANANSIDNEGRSALHWAVYHGKQRMVSLLLKHNADVAMLDYDGRSFAHLCSHDNSTRIFNELKFLVDMSKFINLRDNRGMTPLHWACLHGATAHAQILISLGADIMARDHEGKTAAHWAVTTTNRSLTELLVLEFSKQPFLREASNDDASNHLINIPDLQGRTPLHIAVGIGNTDLAEVLMNVPQLSLVAQDVHGRTALLWAAQLGHADMISLLLTSRGIDQYRIVDANGWNGLHYAAHAQYLDCVELFARYQCEDRQDAHGQTALMLAVQNNSQEIATMLIDKQVSPLSSRDETGSTVLHVAAFVGNLSICERLLQANAQVNALDLQDQTPLFYACEQGHLEVVDKLMEYGAEVHTVDKEGRNPLHFATLGGHAAVCTYLIREAKINPNAQDNGGRTPLHTAAYVGDATTTHVLIGCGADMDLQDSEGISAMHWAAAARSLHCVKALIEANAFPNHTEFHSEKLTPLDYACLATDEDSREIVKYLRANGGKYVVEVREFAAGYIQSWWRDILARTKDTREKREAMQSEPIGSKSPDSDRIERTSSIDKHPKEAIQRLSSMTYTDLVEKQRPSPVFEETYSMSAASTPSIPAKSPLAPIPSKIPKRVQHPSKSRSPRKVSGAHIIPNSTPKPPHRVAALPHESNATEIQTPKTVLRRRETRRLQDVRVKMNAARTIQRWWRRVKRSTGRPKEYYQVVRRQRGGNFQIDETDGVQQIAALTIQLHWRQYLRKLRNSRAAPVVQHQPQRRKRERVMFPWSPEVMAAKRVQRQWQVYGKPHGQAPPRVWKPKTKRVSRPNNVPNFPVVSVTAFNLAYDTYWPEDVRNRIQQKRGTLAKSEKSADDVLESFSNNMQRLKNLRLAPVPSVVEDESHARDNNHANGKNNRRTSNRHGSHMSPHTRRNIAAVR